MTERGLFSDNVNKKKFLTYISKKIKKSVNYLYILSVVSTLFEEIVEDLKNGKELKIHNFGILRLKKLKSKKYHNVAFRKMKIAPETKALKFILFKKIRKNLCKLIDIDATFKDDYS